jgi:[protein-PII] uridylyltransferase
LASEIVHKVLSRRVLYLAVLLHDIAKGRGGNHPELGGQIAERMGPVLGLEPEETENVAWLVRYHVAMSEIAFKRDLSDPQAIADFVALVQSPERLRLLLVLTVCDIRAVGPSVWNGWKAALLRELYRRAEQVMSGGLSGVAEASRLAAAKAGLAGALAGWSEQEIDAHLARLPPSYVLSLEPETLARHARLLREHELSQAPFVLGVRVDGARAVSELAIAVGDKPGLFASLAGAIAAAGADIVDARIVTTADGVALDTFWIQEAPTSPHAAGGAFADANRLRHLREAIARALDGRLDLAAALAGRRRLPSRTQVFQVPARVLIDDKASATHTVIEVNGRDRPGLLFDLTETLAQHKLQVTSAKISTYGERVVDVFYVKDAFGLKVTHPKLIAQVRQALLDALADSAAPAAAAE